MALGGHNQRSAPINPSTTVEDVMAWLRDLPPEARFDVHEEPYINQFDSGSKTISVSWSE